jgi:hypothetical protein
MAANRWGESPNAANRPSHFEGYRTYVDGDKVLTIGWSLSRDGLLIFQLRVSSGLLQYCNRSPSNASNGGILGLPHGGRYSTGIDPHIFEGGGGTFSEILGTQPCKVRIAKFARTIVSLANPNFRETYEREGCVLDKPISSVLRRTGIEAPGLCSVMNDARLPIWIRSKRATPHRRSSHCDHDNGHGLPLVRGQQEDTRPSGTRPLALPIRDERGAGAHSRAWRNRTYQAEGTISSAVVPMDAIGPAARKRRRLEMRSNSTSAPTTEANLGLSGKAEPMETESRAGNSVVPTSPPAVEHARDAGSSNDSLHALLTTLRLRTTPLQKKERGRGRCRQVTRAPLELRPPDDRGDANQQRIIVPTLRKIMDRCRACPWEASTCAMDGRQSGESAGSILCTIPFPLAGGISSRSDRFSESPGAKEPLEYATTVVDAVRSVLGACPEQAFHQRCSGRKETGDTPLRRLLRNDRLLRVVLYADHHNHRCYSSRHLPQRAAPGGCETFGLLLKAAAGITARQGHREESLHSLMDAWKLPVFLSDSCGMFPLDHLIRSTRTLYSETSQPSSDGRSHSNSSPLVLLETFFQVIPSPFETSKESGRRDTCQVGGSHFQPLIKLLTMAHDAESVVATRCMIDMLVRWESTLLFRPSKGSGCLPMHVALEQSSQFLRPDDACEGTTAYHLIQLYDESPTIATSAHKQTIHGTAGEPARHGTASGLVGIVWTHMNRKGELPLHVACRAGASTSLLRVIMERTLVESSRFQSSTVKDTYECTGNRCNPWIWSATNLGASPIDILWEQFLDPALAANRERRKHRIDRPSIADTFGSEDDDVEYRLSLSHGMMVQCNRQWSANPIRPMSSAPCSRDLVLERIILVIRAAFANFDAPPSSWPPVPQFNSLLHAVSALCVPVEASPMVPEPIFDLVLALAVQQMPVDAVRQRDEFGLTALHYCFVSPNRLVDRKPTSRALVGIADNLLTRKIHAWEKWVMRLLQHEPALARTPDSGGRLPLHYALLFRLRQTPRETKHRQRPGDVEVKLYSTFASAKARVVAELTSLVPESIVVRDRRTKLFTFLLAATNKDNKLDMTYELLRRCPNALILFRST